ncbi:ribonuclease P/MRP protein subunit POP5 isoform X2 [Oncorhynchus keta]|uniref:ribonuclease P/MRP protein subunit POP5 isoform X2 n=1 Tax=Oncorhynchus keta TaxID=8018 RepID=UPI00227D6618|nr:ribonuclease P/MRP protein subunit POP5 isoform X2 [Oncorhynchus keta]
MSNQLNLPQVDSNQVVDTSSRMINGNRMHLSSISSLWKRTLKYLNAHTGIVFLRCRKSHYRLIWSALPFITSLENRGQRVPCFLNCLHVGGTIRTCQKFLVRYNTQQLHRMLPLCQSEAERSEIRKSVLSCTLKKEADDEEEEDE